MTPPRLPSDITVIAAVGRDLAIGRDGDLAFHIPADLKRFKQLTMGHPVIMGRKTFESFPNGPLPGRHNIVITRNSAYRADGVTIARSLGEALAIAAGDSDRVFIIGGGEIYRSALPLATTLELTEVDTLTPGADTLFPPYSGHPATARTAGEWQTCPRTGLTYRFLTITLSPQSPSLH